MYSCRLGSQFLRSLIVVVLIFAILVDHTDAKKKSKRKSTGSKDSRRRAPSFRPSPVANSAPRPSSYDVSAQITAGLRQCEDHKTKLVDIGKKMEEQNKDVVEKHNNLVTDYNGMLKKHAAVIDKYNSLVQHLEDPSIAEFLAAKAIKLSKHPGIQGAVNKTKIKVLPVAQEVLLKSAEAQQKWLNKTQADVQAFLESHAEEFIPETWLPSVSGFVVYGSVLIPIAVACWCVLEFVCNLHRLLLFGHTYLSCAGLCAMIFAGMTGDDPLTTFSEHDPELYQFAQVAFALMIVGYFCVSLLACSCMEGDGTFRTLQIMLAVSLCGVYYGLVWTPAMVDESPKVDEIFEMLGVQPVSTDGREDPPTPKIFVMLPYLIVFGVFALLTVFDSADPPKRKVDTQDDDKDA